MTTQGLLIVLLVLLGVSVAWADYTPTVTPTVAAGETCQVFAMTSDDDAPDVYSQSCDSSTFRGCDTAFIFGEADKCNPGGGFEEEMLLQFDTSSIPDGISITSKTLELDNIGRNTEDDAHFVCEGYDWGGACDAADLVSDMTGHNGALDAPISGIANGVHVYTLNTLTINDGGYTRLRCGVSGSPNTNVNSYVEFAYPSFDPGFESPPQLRVCWTTLPTPTGTLPTATITPTPTQTRTITPTPTCGGQLNISGHNSTCPGPGYKDCLAACGGDRSGCFGRTSPNTLVKTATWPVPFNENNYLPFGGTGCNGTSFLTGGAAFAEASVWADIVGGNGNGGDSYYNNTWGVAHGCGPSDPPCVAPPDQVCCIGTCTDPVVGGSYTWAVGFMQFTVPSLPLGTTVQTASTLFTLDGFGGPDNYHAVAEWYHPFTYPGTAADYTTTPTSTAWDLGSPADILAGAAGRCNGSFNCVVPVNDLSQIPTTGGTTNVRVFENTTTAPVIGGNGIQYINTLLRVNYVFPCGAATQTPGTPTATVTAPPATATFITEATQTAGPPATQTKAQQETQTAAPTNTPTRTATGTPPTRTPTMTPNPLVGCCHCPEPMCSEVQFGQCAPGCTFGGVGTVCVLVND